MNWVALAGSEEPFFKSNGRNDRNYVFLWLSAGVSPWFRRWAWALENILGETSRAVPRWPIKWIWWLWRSWGSHFPCQTCETTWNSISCDFRRVLVHGSGVGYGFLKKFWAKLFWRTSNDQLNRSSCFGAAGGVIFQVKSETTRIAGGFTIFGDC